MATLPVSQPTNTYFFPNGLGEGQPVAIEAISLEEAQAKLATLLQPAPAKASVPADQSAEKEA